MRTAETDSAILRFFREKRAEEFRENVAAEAERFSWDRMVETIEDLYESCSDHTGL